MVQRILSKLLEKPGKKNGLSLSLGYCFTVILIVLLVVSSSLSSSYLSVLKQDKADSLRSFSALSATALSGKPVQEGMVFPLPVLEYKVNAYTKAGNSFLNVYSSYLDRSSGDTQAITLEVQGTDEDYRGAFDQQKIVISRRTENKISYITAVAPIVNADGTTAGIVEVLMEEASFVSTNNGISLSWFFTVFSIAAALTIIFYQIRKLLDTVLEKPDSMLPKIIRYGIGGCQSIAFFSAIACSLPALVIGENIRSLAMSSGIKDETRLTLLLLLAGAFFAVGFFSLNNLKSYLARLFTTRMALLVSVGASILLFLISRIFPYLPVYFLSMFPMGFFLGMVFYFQREYRLYASRLGYAEFSERKIHMTQYIGFLLGASVGAVFAGVVYERFGWYAIAILSGALLLLVLFQALFFVQHCPPSNAPRLYIPTFLYALSNSRSGTFLLSAIMPLGINLAFFMVFIPHFLQTLSYSLATVAFYYILFFIMGAGVVKFVMHFFSMRLSTNARVFVSAVFQILGYVLLAFFPTAKVLVVTVCLLGISSGFHEFRYLPYYTKLIQEDKRQLAKRIVEAVFALGVIIGTILSNVIFFVRFSEIHAENFRIGLLIFTFIMAFLLLAYPLMLLFAGGSGTPRKGGSN